MVMPAPAYYSVEMVRALPDEGHRHETVHGELLVTPAPSAWHQELIARLLVPLRIYLERHRCGHAVVSPADISWGPDTLVQPDLFVVPVEQAKTMDWVRMKTLLLVVEVLSPATARADRFSKRRLYQEMSVPTYWIVDPENRAVEVWTPEAELPQIERESLGWMPAGAAEAFSLDLGELFRQM